ncbi:MAG TPA: hypothetical protein VHT03_07885 [Rhizomicrobium sp.]|jgi:hypothetical protein|nr:hypothetical protein [Rhizomicrobium sp.]
MSKSLLYPKDQKLSIALGELTICWGWLETGIDELITEMAELDNEKVAHCVTARVGDIRSKVKLAKALGFICKTDEGWFRELLKVLDKVDNDLRPRRNDFVHTHWIHPKGRLTRRHRRTKLVKPQAFQMELITQQDIPEKLSSIYKLNSEISDCWMNLMVLYWYIMREDGERLTQPPLSFQQYLRALKSAQRRQRASQARKPRQRSSRKK